MEPTPAVSSVTNEDETAKIINLSKCKIGIQPITLEDIDLVTNIKMVKGNEALKEAVI